MQYMLIAYETAADCALRDGPEAPAYWGAWMAYSKAVAESGIMIGGNGLEPPATATTVRLRDGQRRVQDGPFADTKEQLGGYFIVEVPDLDKALEWAARMPCAATGSVEVRPVLPPPPM
ncbi:MAG TPA: YciI family protein [Beijerinckiaceae bacterium]|jgi:hypothetical protein